MIELKCGAGELTGRVAGEPEALLAELSEAVALVLDRIDELMREQGYSAAARANLPNALWQGVHGKRRSAPRTRKDG